ncbi:MAG: hypothetical protein A3I76_02495 [Elusimicrobia bacterium RIFCSPLOWO2_02_FULL_61_11]|nr:MAG: hypothetical protein A3I76_02495 [Elusimicrobia bacterium RIFCSPLOWO2_02_FULL_61_11]
MEIIGDADGLVREVLEMARRESAGIVAAAEAESGKIISEAEAAAGKVRREMAEAARAGAARRREMMLAALPGEEARLRLERQEALLDSIRTEAVKLIRAEAAGADKKNILAALAAGALGRMEGKKFTVAVPTGGGAAGQAAEIERLAGRGPLELSIEEEAGLAGGVRVRDGEGRQYWDNSFAARLERLWPGLRGRLLGPGEGK